ncbi:MAG: bifunctional pyr operon transcriptional regulator/uracil phosphoribosyltransferase PyrR [Deltaproteobacteria bacterium]|nr:bifunctional pyr operon transcriptional regulator/uracil phosphoribosyltransferase PyrR [Deltaproteobacteria bacterium]
MAERVVMDADEISRALRRMAGEITEQNRGAKALCLVGIRRGGVPLAYRLRVLLRELEGLDVPVGSVDINLYRDDVGTSLAAPIVGRSDLHFPLDDRVVLLIDDVLFTGRTVRAAIDALMDYGRPRSIQLCCLIDRGHRELPIAAQYVGREVHTAYDDRVDVVLDSDDRADCALVIESDADDGA